MIFRAAKRPFLGSRTPEGEDCVADAEKVAVLGNRHLFEHRCAPVFGDAGAES